MTQAHSPAAMLEEVAKGAAFRATGKTNMNDASSRSHAILLIVVSDGVPEKGVCLYMVDLAGSERQKRSGATGQAFVEMVGNNLALSALGRVVASLVERDGQRAAHIGYKDNPLTHLLKCGIGGASKTALIACVTKASDSIDESLNTLRFALQASHVKNQVKNKEAKDQAAAEADAIADAAAGSGFRLSGEGSVPLPGGALPVRGTWGSGSGKAIICVHDFEGSGADFAGIVPFLGDSVLAPDFNMPTEKDIDVVVAQLLALIDYLGVAKPVFYGRDFGAICVARFKMTYPARVGALVLQDAHDNVKDAAAFKKRKNIFTEKKASPNYTNHNSFFWFCDFRQKGKETAHIAKLKGPVLLLFPFHISGNPDPKCQGAQGQSMWLYMGAKIAKQLKTEMVDFFGKSDEEVGELIMGAVNK
mmetsp:Transcript_61464/g.138688  ORF Transcript_61464/g.138688 Transcript_61464/m.138688 type:complete len:418 (+) Transcript_61464:3-1256(+)